MDRRGFIGSLAACFAAPFALTGFKKDEPLYLDLDKSSYTIDTDKVYRIHVKDIAFFKRDLRLSESKHGRVGLGTEIHRLLEYGQQLPVYAEPFYPLHTSEMMEGRFIVPMGCGLWVALAARALWLRGHQEFGLLKARIVNVYYPKVGLRVHPARVSRWSSDDPVLGSSTVPLSRSYRRR